MSRFDKLTAICRKLGYHGICPEALEELMAIRPEMDVFMEGMREMFAPRETDRHRSVEIEVLELVTIDDDVKTYGIGR